MRLNERNIKKAVQLISRWPHCSQGDYETSISRFNLALRIVGRRTPCIYIKTDLIHTDTEDWSSNYRDAFAPQFKVLVQHHSKTRDVLQDLYPWALE